METRMHVLFCVLLIIFIAGTHISRELDVHAPVLSLLVLSYSMCFCVTVLWKKSLSFIKQDSIDQQAWDPLLSKENTRHMFMMCACISAQALLARIARAYCEDTQRSWAVDIWSAFMPIFVALLTGVSNDDVLITSGGTALAITCGSVLMLPFTAFGGRIEANVCSILETFFNGGALVLAHKLLNNKVSPASSADLIMNSGALVPLVLILPIGFIEIPLILQYFTRPWMYIIGKGLIDTLVLLITQAMIFVMLLDTPALFVSGVYGVATAFSILLTGSLLSVIGFVCVLAAFGVHTKILVYSRKNELYSKIEPLFIEMITK